MGETGNAEGRPGQTWGNAEVRPEGRARATLRPAAGGLTLREAAQQLGVTEKVLRGRVRRGEVEAWQTQGKFGLEWRLRLPDLSSEPCPTDDRALTGGQTYPSPSLDEVRPTPDQGETSGQSLGNAIPPAVPAETYRELLTRHEAATVRLGYLQAQTEQIKAIAARAESLEERATTAEQKARQVAEERSREQEARRRAEEEAEGLRRRVSAAEGALEAERSKGFWGRVFGR